MDEDIYIVKCLLFKYLFNGVYKKFEIWRFKLFKIMKMCIINEWKFLSIVNIIYMREIDLF